MVYPTPKPTISQESAYQMVTQHLLFDPQGPLSRHFLLPTQDWFEGGRAPQRIVALCDAATGPFQKVFWIMDNRKKPVSRFVTVYRHYRTGKLMDARKYGYSPLQVGFSAKPVRRMVARGMLPP
jgi:hypothetical protein